MTTHGCLNSVCQKCGTTGFCNLCISCPVCSQRFCDNQYTPTFEIPKTPEPFCSFCDCEECQTGISVINLTHAQTEDGTWICDVCFLYDLCTFGTNRAYHPCKSMDCEHRPKLISDFIK